MNIATLIWAYVRRRPLTWAFHVLMLALGVSVVTSLFLVQRGLELVQPSTLLTTKEADQSA